MKKMIYIIIVNCLLLIANCYSQPSITWQRLYNGPQSWDDEAYAICNADGENFYITGYTRFPVIGRIVYVLKINPYGDTIWTKVIPINSTGGIANAILPTLDGGCVVTGEKTNVKFLIRLDKNGNIVWQYTYPGLAIYYDIKRAINGDYICAGFYQNGGTSLRIDSLGNVKYDRLYPNNFFYFHTIQPTSDNGCLIGGDWGSSERALIARLDSNGNMIDSKYFTVDNQRTYSFTFEKDNNNNYVLGGNFWNGAKNIPYFIKLDSNLNPLDTHIFPQVRNEIAHAMKVLPNGKYVWTFDDETTNSYDSSFSRFLITDNAGNIIHDKIKYNKAYEEFVDIKPVSNGDIIFVGSAEYSANPTAFDDIFAIRTDSLLNFPASVIGIKQIDSNIPVKFTLFQNYPNPFNPFTKIRFDLSLPKNGNAVLKVKLIVYDILGRMIDELVNTQLKPGNYEVQFDATNISSGLYFYSLEVNDYRDTKKLTVIK